MLNLRIKLIDDLHLNTGQTSDQVVLHSPQEEDVEQDDSGNNNEGYDGDALDSSPSDPNILEVDKPSKNIMFKRI